MFKKTLLLTAAILAVSAAANLYAQSPLSLDLGFGGGATLPSGKLTESDGTGWHAGMKARLRGILPLNIVASGLYHKIPNTVGGESDVETMFGGGIEYPLPSPAVKPYFGMDVNLTILSNTAAPSDTRTREGVGLGAGIEFDIPMFGSFDTSLKYQLLNLVGKQTDEETVSQIAANFSLMLNLL